MMQVEEITRRKKPGRKVEGIAAALLPFETDGQVAVEAFQNHLRATQRAGLMNAVNMDTGYVNFLSESEKLEVLGWTRGALGASAQFVAGGGMGGGGGGGCFVFLEEKGGGGGGGGGGGLFL